DDRDRTVEFGPCDASSAMLGGQQTSFAIDGVAVRVHRRLAEYADVTIVLGKAHDAVIGDVAEEHHSPRGEVDRAFGPAESGGDAFNRHGTGESRETRPERGFGRLLGRLEARV